MRHRAARAVAFGLLIALTTGPIASGQGAQPASGPGAQASAGRRVRAVRIPNGRIAVDGRLDEAEWQQAEPAGDFLQQQPAEGAPSSEPSDVRFVYDDDTLYVGATLYDREPDLLITNELKRDFNARDGDLFVVVLDTFHDRRNSYGFQTNPMGAQRENQGYDDGRVINQNWDTVWRLETSTFDAGWRVEYAIPFKSLRFADLEEQSWGLNMMRLIRRKNEITMWTPVPRQFNQFKVSYAGVLEGLRGISPGRDLRVKPFVTSRLSRTGEADDADVDGGLDVKMGIGTGLVLDATLRTDFSQVEADEQQINLTRFSLFFPEKREFFLENQGIFQVGPLATQNQQNSVQQSGPPDLVPFFSRRIGLSDGGSPIPIVGGVRLSGKAGRSTIGLLNIQAERDPAAATGTATAAHGTNYTALRYGREFLSNSSGGAFYLAKETPGDSNRVVGTDLRLNLRRSLDVDALVMRSSSERGGAGTAWRAGFEYDTNRTRYRANRTSLDSGFRDDLGFIPRSGVDITNLGFAQRFRPRSWARIVREIRPELPYTRYDKEDFGLETETLTPSLFLDFQDGSLARVTVGANEEAITVPFRIRSDYAIAPGRYRFNDASTEFSTSRARALSLTGEFRTGEFWNGTRRGFSTGGRVRFSPKLATQWSYVRDHIALPGIAFTTSRASLRVDGSFSTRMFLNAFIQYNAVTRETLTNIRFNFIHHPLSDLFVVYNESRFRGGASPDRRTLILKLTHLVPF